MSRGQRPRRRAYFPRMKERGKYRPRRPRVTVYDANWRAVWPQPKRIDVVAFTPPKVGRFGGHVIIGRKIRLTSGNDAHLIAEVGPPIIETKWTW
ncbi:hypothetical protein SEA_SHIVANISHOLA_61 [Gordonia phage Shivanishola]|nr:hypothetical protein SEA_SHIVANISHOLA_61 [Gordonia phage Shivanishola]